jgi:demethylmenaquinone methyltransferase/2-methoxy-6-polyprenyl-1,4-benzoquinol methylase
LSGLGQRYWWQVIEVLRLVIPVYDKVNKAISLGKDSKFRLRGVQGHVFSGDTILDAGSGYGNMSTVALTEAKGNAKIILYDPIPEMLANINKLFGPNLPKYLSSGVFEYMPFQHNAFDVVMCGYSLRDAFELKQAIAEIHRVLKQGGRLIVVDLGKPDNPLLRAFVSVYLRYILGIVAFMVAGKVGLQFKTLYGTYKRWPKNSGLYTLLNEKFSKVVFHKVMMGGAIIAVAYK